MADPIGYRVDVYDKPTAGTIVKTITTGPDGAGTVAGLTKATDYWVAATALADPTGQHTDSDESARTKTHTVDTFLVPGIVNDRGFDVWWLVEGSDTYTVTIKELPGGQAKPMPRYGNCGAYIEAKSGVSYEVTVVNDRSKESHTITVTAATRSTKPLPAVKNLRGTTTVDSATPTWDPVPEALLYRVRYQKFRKDQSPITYATTRDPTILLSGLSGGEHKLAWFSAACMDRNPTERAVHVYPSPSTKPRQPVPENLGGQYTAGGYLGNAWWDLTVAAKKMAVSADWPKYNAAYDGDLGDVGKPTENASFSGISLQGEKLEVQVRTRGDGTTTEDSWDAYALLD